MSTDARASARDHSRERSWFIPPSRDPRGRGRCIYPRCEVGCEKFQPACSTHWRVVPELLREPIEAAWRGKDQRRWLLAIEALRLHWFSTHAAWPTSPVA